MDMGLIFAVIVSIILMGLLITFGYMEFEKWLRIQEEAEIKRNIQEFREAVTDVYGMGGEASAPFEFTFPNSVYKVCFIPSYKERLLSSRENSLRDDLRKIIDSDWRTRQDLSQVLANMRIVTLNNGSKIDKGHNLMIFFHSTSVPMFEKIDHFDPSLKSIDGLPMIPCLPQNTKFWLKRKHEGINVWVDVDLN